MIQCIIFKFRKWHACNYEWYRLYRSYENCRRPGVAILDMQMSKVPIISGYEFLGIVNFRLPFWYSLSFIIIIITSHVTCLRHDIAGKFAQLALNQQLLTQETHPLPSVFILSDTITCKIMIIFKIAKLRFIWSKHLAIHLYSPWSI